MSSRSSHAQKWITAGVLLLMLAAVLLLLLVPSMPRWIGGIAIGAYLVWFLYTVSHADPKTRRALFPRWPWS